jgi:predicted permease
MDALLLDLRYAMRSLLRTRGFALGAVIVLALGIGANTAIFSLVNALLLRPLPFHDPDRLAWVWSSRVDRDKAFFSIPNFLDARRQSRSFERMIAFANWGANLTGAGDPERLQGVRILPEAFEMLGVRPAVGRILNAADAGPDAPRAVVLGYGLWRRRFGADRGIVGRTVSLNGDAHVVAGVLPRDFLFPGTTGAEFAVPLDLASDPRREERGSNFMRVFGRLTPNATPAAAAAELTAIADRLRRDYPVDNAKLGATRVLPLREEIVSGYRHALFLLLGAVGLVLLVACANLAHLMLVRASGRRHEIAVRLAVGATRARLARQLLVESTLISLIGGALGVMLASWGTQALLHLAPSDLPRAGEVAIDGRVLLFTTLSCIVATLVCGLAPALGASRTRLGESLSGAGRIAGPSDVRARSAFVVAQVAVSLALLFAAGLFIRSLSSVESIDPGFDPDRLSTARLALPAARYGTPADVVGFCAKLTPRLAQAPGVRAVAIASIVPLSGMNTRADFFVADAPPASSEQAPGAQNRWVSPGYFGTLGIPILAGREFADRDGPDAQPVVVIDRALARRFFPNRSPIGVHLLVSDAGETMRNVEIVGVVGDVMHFGLTDEPTPTFYAPIPQVPAGAVSFLANSMNVVLRTQGAPEAIAERVRNEVRATDADVPASQFKTMDALLAASTATKRFSTRLLAVFAIAALLLATTGLYALVSYSVGMRRREIGVRMALGAAPADVRTWVIRQAVILALAGVACGVPIALILARLASSQLYRIGAQDPATLGAAAVLLVVAALLASWWPARRATRVDPAVALRAE